MGDDDFTPREQEIMSLAWQCFEGEPKVDYKKLAGLCGMSNPVSASNAWSRIKKKLNAQASKAGGGATANDKTDSAQNTPKATPGKRVRAKKAKAENEDGEDDDGDMESPSKKVQSRKGKAGKLDGINGASEENEDEGSSVKKEDEGSGEEF